MYRIIIIVILLVINCNGVDRINTKKSYLVFHKHNKVKVFISIVEIEGHEYILTNFFRGGEDGNLTHSASCENHKEKKKDFITKYKHD
jgi:hypothetical protein